MERKIKFKVYLNGVLWGYEELREDGWYSMCLELNPDSGERWNKIVFRDGNFVRKQFIGLCDKNGKEIYEGDILRLETWNPSDMWVRFIEGAFCLTALKKSKAFERGEFIGDIHYIQHADNPQSEIIGNIYENPELAV